MDNCNCNSLKKPTCKTAAGLTIVIIPAQSGDSEGLFAPKVGDYKNTLVKYMADSKVFLYDKDGNWTLVGTSVVPGVTLDTELSLGSTNGVQNKVITKAINDTNDRVDETKNNLIIETDNRANADITLQDNIDGEALARQNADGTLQGNIDAEALTRGNADLTLQGNIDAEALARANAISGVETKINRDLIADLVMTADADNVTFTEQKINPNTGATSAEQDVIPAASATTAGTISATEYQTLKDSEELLDAILEGAAAVTGISATPTQTELTNAWLAATGNPQLINRASIYDVDNELIWTYYTNTSEWYSAVASITLDPFTNSTAGTIKGSTTAGNVSANADGTGTVSGWATLVGEVAAKADSSSLATVATSGDYDDLNNKPTYPVITAEWDSVNQRFDATTGENLANVPDGTKFKVKFDTAINNNGIALKIDGIGYAFIVTTDAVSNSTGTTTNLQDTNTTYIYEILKQTIGGNLYWTCTNSFTDMQVPTITMTTTDPGAGSALAANTFIAVYEP